MSEYPIILIPKAIQEARLKQPPAPKPPNLPIPVYPGDAPKRIHPTLIVAEVISTILLSSAIDSFVGGNLGMILLLGGLGVIATQVRQQWVTFGKRKRNHQHKIAVYRREKKERERQQVLYYEQQQAYFRDNEVLKVLSRTKPHDGNSSKAYQGGSEAQFSNYLLKYFGKNIYTKLTVNIPNFHHPYSPDFCYIDSKINLYIDIEIDEPYSYKDDNLKPIHYIGADEKRDRFFLQRGWIVIRFSEEQIVKYPESCCKTVAKTIDDLLSDDALLKQFADIPSLAKRRQWTYSEAEKMAQSDYRKAYRHR